MTTAARPDAILPDGPSGQRLVKALTYALNPDRTLHRYQARYGSAFSINAFGFGRMVVLTDPAEVKQILQATQDVIDLADIGVDRALGHGSLFATYGDAHRRDRKLLTPPLHGNRLRAYEKVVERAAESEMATWPEGRPFPALPSMMRITLDVILDAVFGAEGAELEELRRMLPPMVKLGTLLTFLPKFQRLLGSHGPWARFQRDRARFDVLMSRLIDQATPVLDTRDDVLAMLLQARYDDGSPMGHAQISDQMLTLMAAGHETTATTLAWVVERIRRQEGLSERLAAEVDEGGSALRDSTLLEVQRVRPVVNLVNREVRAENLEIGRWRLPRGTVVGIPIGLLHDDPNLFGDPSTFNPGRFVGAKPNTYQWIPFGGGVRRCIGANFATLEMNVVVRTMFRDFIVEPTTDGPERRVTRGIAAAPGKGGMMIVRRRT
ncbi:cytochrome P450 [Saccharopolyspora sp. NFXS83]|uniref:cytochrome P450 n=1 Tax=Saccharopolyspora sp. NFXS83 TaxID=2993560 RepID=UPI00224B3BF8|nr:cytochrome P450 [Saccharopolyspora sp. NFXS83]MCX2734466.1 cytochrome P450 [Saccharopolyspora sp. NFXS83]